MLEIKNLTKIYKTKGGEDVRALDDVSIKFEDTGLVFLLGKSGSGKSTLLNLAGGLDEPTSGEIIVMGKSSKSFSGSDFDSYRNTFIGFVFQEYNVLNEFNVADNVALALELQGKTKSREKVMQILEEVELSNFAKRKPNTLSGGQKQRIAIARALVKDPQIIMADEPTGALDSATGKQVFDTLKRLSETRLVLVVSHDREFAEIYGDRIVELKDGKIISDVTKVKEAAASLSGNVKQIGLDTLTVQSGAVDDATMQKIRAFLSESRGEVLIARGEKEIAGFRRVNHIDENGAQERFTETTDDLLEIKEYDGKAKFIRSRLPARKAIKIGASGLKLKPFRLVLTIFLSLVSFVMFGLFSTMMLYDPTEVLVHSFLDSDNEYLTYTKSYETRGTYGQGSDTYTYTNHYDAKFTPEELKTLGGDGAFGVYAGNNVSSFGNLGPGENTSRYYQPLIRGLTVLPAEHKLRQAIVGSYPTADNEICVSGYFFECVKNCTFHPVEADGTVDNKAQVSMNNIQDLIGQKLLVNDYTPIVLTVTGVFEDGTIPEKYDSLKEQNNNTYSELTWEFDRYLQESLHAIAFGTDRLAETLFSSDRYEYIEYFEGAENEFSFYLDYDNDGYSLDSTNSVSVYEYGKTKQLPIYRFDGKTDALKDDEIILNMSSLERYVDYCKNEWEKTKYEDPDYTAWLDEINAEREREYPQDSDPKYWTGEPYADGSEFDQDQYNRDLDAWQEKWNSLMDSMKYPKDEEFEELYNDFAIFQRGDLIPTAEEKAQALKNLQEFVDGNYKVTITVRNQSFGYDSPEELLGRDYKVVGFYCFEADYWRYNGIYCSQNFYDSAKPYSRDVPTEETKYVPEEDATYRLIFAPLTKNEALLRSVFEKIDTVDPDTDIIYSLTNDLYSSVYFVNTMVEELSLVFLIVGLVLMAFAALLLFNFISISISNKKKEIGILRAVGARGTDVFKIFFSEAGIIVGICLILSLVGTFATALFLNSYLKAEAGLQVTLFVFGFPSVAIMFGVALVVALLGTFLPVFFAARKKPVESIRAL